MHANARAPGAAGSGACQGARRRPAFIALAALALCAPCGLASCPMFSFSELGYAPAATKHATVSGQSCGRRFELIDVMNNDTVVFAGNTSKFPAPERTGKLCLADFSSLTAPGTYRIVLASLGRSPSFPISHEAMNGARCVHLCIRGPPPPLGSAALPPFVRT